MSKGLTSRRRNTPWIQRWSRVLIGTIAVLGALNTAYLTINRYTNTAAACPTSGCEQVLASPYATVFGQPLALFGLLAYLAMAAFAFLPLAVNPETNKPLRTQLEDWTWLLLFAGSTAMLIFSGYLMNIMVSQFVLKYGAGGICYYCIASALFALALFVLTLLGRAWDDVGQLFLIGFTVGIVTLVGTLGIYANINSPSAQTPNTPGQVGPPIVNTSGPAEIELAKHLTASGAKMYEAYWCPHCHEQKELFGQQASSFLTHIECAKDGKNSQTDRCLAAKVEGFPTWEIQGKLTSSGRKTLQELADLTGYTGSRAFRNRG